MTGGTSAQRLADCMPFIFREEGGLSMIRSDRGNWTSGKVGVGELRGTKYGIASHSHPTLDIKNLTKDQATVIYANDYWSPSGCPELPAGVDLVVMDHSVNAGVSRGKAYATQTSNMAPEARIKAISAKRAAWYKGIRDFAKFGKVWLGRTSRAEAAGLKMALKAAGLSSAATSIALQQEADKAAGQVKKGQAGAMAAGTAGSATAMPGAVVESGTSWGLIIVGVGICLVLLLLAIHFMRAKEERRIALQVEANTL